MSALDKKRKPEFCIFCKGPVWDGVWVEGKVRSGETWGAIVCSKHVERAKKMIKETR